MAKQRGKLKKKSHRRLVARRRKPKQPATQPFIDKLVKESDIVNEYERVMLLKHWHATKCNDRMILTRISVQIVPKAVTLYHGTDTINAASIMARGLKLPKRYGMFGRGIYLGGWGKASFFGDAIFTVSANLGRIKIMSGSKWDISNPTNFDTIHGVAGRTASWGGTLRNDEYCVYDSRRITVVEVSIPCASFQR